MITTLKQGFGIVLVMAFLAGCSSTDTVDNNDTDSSDNATSGISGNDTLGGSNGTSGEGDLALDNIVYFSFDQALLLPETRKVLLAHADHLRDSGSSVRLEGHADERGSREYNMALGERRANAVRDFLVLQGVGRGSMEVISYGEEQPLELGHNEAAWAKNRRVEIKY